MATKESEISLARLVDQREQVHRKHENLLAQINTREDTLQTPDERETLLRYRKELSDYDEQIGELSAAVTADRQAEEESRRVRRAMAGDSAGVEFDAEGVVYHDYLAYARDVMLARSVNSSGELAKFATNWGGEEAVNAANERLQFLKRTPANTLTSNVGGLTPPQHIAQIFQVINMDRPIVASATRTTLDRLTLTYPSVSSKPVVAVQSSEKTEAGNTGLVVDLASTTASTYLGGGNISWQAAQLATPSALELWFSFVSADYALKTEQDAAQVISHSSFTYAITSPLSSTPTFADFMTAVGAGGAKVYTSSGRMADTVYMAVDRYWYLFGTTSQAAAQFTTVSGDGVGPLRFVPSRGLDAGVVIVGDSDALLVAENAGAPVEMRVVEPAIGGFEVGLIGAFEAVVADPGAFSMITTAS